MPTEREELLGEAKRLGLMGAESWKTPLLRQTVAAYQELEQRGAA